MAVTGSRGKSGVVRLIHAAFCACGLKAFARITGVVPRELQPDKERAILRPAGANVSEMKWWLSHLPNDTEAIVMENSAVNPDLQGLCAHWLQPQVIVLTNVRPDHESYWGPKEVNVLRALSPALPRRGTIVIPQELAEWPPMCLVAEKKHLQVITAEPAPGFPPHLSINIGLALKACNFFGMDQSLCFDAMKALPPDFADFSVLSVGEGKLAFAFSANDVFTTEELFQSIGWKREETSVLFNHRADRIDRFRCFEDWMTRYSWQSVLIIGDRPPRTRWGAEYIKFDNIKDLAHHLNGGQWIGCGNTVRGLTLSLKLACDEGNLLL